MNLVAYLVIALCLVTYLLIGMIISYHSPLGNSYYPKKRFRLVFLWIFPIILIVSWTIIILAALAIEVVLFGDNSGNPGLETFFKQF